MFFTCIHTFSNMQSHLHPLPMYGYSGCILSFLMPTMHKIHLGGINFRTSTCNACTCTRANTGEYYLCIGFMQGSTVAHRFTYRCAYEAGMSNFTHSVRISGDSTPPPRPPPPKKKNPNQKRRRKLLSSLLLSSLSVLLFSLLSLLL